VQPSFGEDLVRQRSRSAAGFESDRSTDTDDEHFSFLPQYYIYFTGFLWLALGTPLSCLRHEGMRL